MAQQSGDECWEWPMSRTAAGYGQLGFDAGGKRSTAYAHRAAYQAHHGAIPEGAHICHRCDNPCCFNPAHLFAGSAIENMQDMAAKGRSNKGRKLPIGERHWTKSRRSELRGSANGNSKLTEADVLAIRASRETGVALASRYGVTGALISAIRKRKVWPGI